MNYESYAFRHADRLLVGMDAWADLRAAIQRFDSDLVVERHLELTSDKLERGVSTPAGAQTAMNSLFEDFLPDPPWTHQPRLFRQSKSGPGVGVDPLKMSLWKMDFLRDRLGVEVAFNHAEAVAWQFTRLNIAGESERVLAESQIDVGVVVAADQSLKSWGRMDSAVLTFETCRAWLREMRAILPIPILVVGLSAASWAPTTVFRGTRKHS
ncbi:MAG: BglII/BstYI family type II restriction endonuclease [Vicinamibacteria bacterium]